MNWLNEPIDTALLEARITDVADTLWLHHGGGVVSGPTIGQLVAATRIRQFAPDEA